MAKPKIDPDALRQFLETGHTQADAARHFGVSEPAIHQRLRKLKQLTSRVMALERAGEVVEEKQASATARLERVQRIIDNQLSWAEEQTRREGADRMVLADTILKLTAEVRQQLGLQLQISRTLIDMREVRDFRQTVVDILAQESPEVARRLIATLKARQALRQRVNLLPSLDDEEGSSGTLT
jgi:DNA-binding Lrp family transcriptional regulator